MIIINKEKEQLSGGIKVIKNQREILNLKVLNFKNHWIEMKKEIMNWKEDQYK